MVIRARLPWRFVPVGGGSPQLHIEGAGAGHLLAGATARKADGASVLTHAQGPGVALWGAYGEQSECTDAELQVSEVSQRPT